MCYVAASSLGETVLKPYLTESLLAQVRLLIGLLCNRQPINESNKGAFITSLYTLLVLGMLTYFIANSQEKNARTRPIISIKKLFL